MIKVKAKIDKVLYPQNGQISNGEWAIISCSPDEILEGDLKLSRYGNFVVKGNVPSISYSDTYKIIAEFKEDKDYGDYYELIYMSSDYNLDNQEDKRKFLEAILTEPQIKKLYEFTDDPFTLIKNEDIKSLVQVNGIGVKSALKLIDKFKSNIDNSKAYIALNNYGLSKSMIDRLVSEYKSVDILIGKLKDDPYILANEVSGIGFKKADAIALNMGMERNDIRRVLAFIQYYLYQEAQNGNSWVDINVLYTELLDNVGDDLSDELFGQAMTKLHQERTIWWDDEKTRIALYYYYQLEYNISKELKRLIEADKYIRYPENISDTLSKIEMNQGWTFTDEQKQAIQGALENNISIITGSGGTGKAMPVWLKIPTPNGEKLLGELKVGDYVFDRHGKPTKVLGVYPQGKLNCYEVTLADGRKTYCNDEHLWTYYTSKGNFKTTTLKKMIENGIYYDNTTNKRFKIPVAKAVEYTKKEYSVDPYVLGVFLGDGSCTSKALTLCSDDEFVVSEVAKIIGSEYCKDSDKNFNWRFLLPNKIRSDKRKYIFTEDIFKDYPEVLKLSHEKRIPKVFFYGSIEQRLNLIQGLMDTDGHIQNSKRGNVSYSSTSFGLILDIQYILRSLGYHSTIVTDRRENRRVSYQLNVNINNDEKYKIFRLPRRKNIALSLKNVKKNRKYDRVGIASIKATKNKDDMVCIYVDNNEHLFLANDFIVTHNTSSVKAVVEVLKEEGYIIAQTALSGRAASRLAEITKDEGFTIHRLLGYNPFEGFAYNKSNPMPVDVIILDECSMLGGDLFFDLIKAIKSGCKLIMLGDEGQLESIGTLNLFKDMIESEIIPVYRLTKIHRQAQKSAIITESIKVRKQKHLIPLDWTGKEIRGELQDLVLDIHSESIYTFPKVIDYFQQELERLGDVSKIWCIVPTKFSGDACVYELNNEMQQLYNPPKNNKKEIKLNMTDKKNKYSYILREGDKIIIRKNEYRKTMSLEGDITPIFNGNIGILESIDYNSVIVNLDEIGQVIVPKNKCNIIQLGYAITAHSAQGSQCDTVIVGMDFSGYTLLSKEWLYTAMTRATKKCILCAETKSLRYAIKTSKVPDKQTFLKMMLRDENL